MDHDGEPYEEADLTVGKVYDMHPNRRNDGFYVMTDINTMHYFDSLDSPADESGLPLGIGGITKSNKTAPLLGLFLFNVE